MQDHLRLQESGTTRKGPGTGPFSAQIPSQESSRIYPLSQFAELVSATPDPHIGR